MDGARGSRTRRMEDSNECFVRERGIANQKKAEINREGGRELKFGNRKSEIENQQ